MQYVFSMTSRMLAVTCACALALCILLFLLGVEIGRMLAGTPLPPIAPVVLSVPGGGTATLGTPAPAAPSASAPAAAAPAAPVPNQ